MHLLVSLLFHELTSLHPPSFQGNDFSTCYKKYWIVLKRLANQLHNRDINLSACRLLCYRVDIWDGSCKAKISAFHRELRARVVAECAHTPLHSARAREITYRVNGEGPGSEANAGLDYRGLAIFDHTREFLRTRVHAAG